MLYLDVDPGGTHYLRTVFSMESQLKPTELHGDILTISDDLDHIEVWNWRLGTSAILQHPHHDAGSGAWQVECSIGFSLLRDYLTLIRSITDASKSSLLTIVFLL